MKSFLVLLGLAGIFLPAQLSAQLVFSDHIWINEFHYDNDGGDTGEFLEIVVTSQISDLSQFDIVLYNGDSNSLSTYKTVNVEESFILGSSADGYSYYLWEGGANSIQNGPDGVALVHNSSEVLEFISYESAFTAANGPASGLTSIQIAVSEPGNTPIGSSIGLSGSGAKGSDFTWTNFNENASPGAINVDQVLIPEPSTYAACAAIFVLLFAMARKRFTQTRVKQDQTN